MDRIVMGSRDYLTSSLPKVTKTSRPFTAQGTGLEFELTKTELGQKAKVTVDDLNSTLITSMNEPALALYRIQEHIRKSVPRVLGLKSSSTSLSTELAGGIADAEYANEGVATACRSLETFKSTNNYLKNAIHVAQQIRYQQARAKNQTNDQR